ncbi:MAG: hypothetical protein NTZ32_06800 [Planctomycetales bacterium]|nr:hypothetical protein [Planctomycetales bacterium]
MPTSPINTLQVRPVASKPATNVPLGNVAVTPAIDPLLTELDRAIELTSKRLLTANTHSPWQIFHGILAMKSNFQLKLGDGKISAIEWIATSEPRFDNLPLLLKTEHGAKFHPYTRTYAFEGHPAQFMALLTQSNLPIDYKFKIGGEQFALTDFLNNIMKEVNSKEEVTWVLWTLQHYLRTDVQWTNQFNEPWSIEKLVQLESAAPVNGAACGGNHRLFALTRTRDKHLLRGGRLEGVWAQADLKIRQHVELARQLQNTDGSFSAKFYEAPGVTNDVNKRFNTTGHTMEFLSIGVPTHRLNEQWLRNAASVLSRELVYNAQRPIDCGPLYHTLNSLMIYRDRLREQDAGWLAAQAFTTPKIAQAIPVVTPPVQLRIAPAVPAPTVADSSATNAASTTPPLSPMPKLAEAPKPSDVVQPVPERADLAKPADATKPVEAAKPDEVAKPSEPKPSDTPAPPMQKPSTAPVPAESSSSTFKSSPSKLSTAIKRPDFARSVTILRTIDSGRVVQMRPVEQPAAVGRPALLPDVNATTLNGFDLSITDEQESFDSTPGTLKPRFGLPPRASRISVPKAANVLESIVIPPSLNAETNDEPASALVPANPQ